MLDTRQKKEVVFKSVPVLAKTRTRAYEYVFLRVCFGFPDSSAYTRRSILSIRHCRHRNRANLSPFHHLACPLDGRLER